MPIVTSVELQKHFGPVREKALKEPVTVTHHGRPSLVVLSLEEFNRLKSLDTRKHYYAWELPDDLGAELEKAVPAPACTQFAHEDVP
ncbi:MAG: type II toxin-antitoxin system Phd/YefM family antitoxin [Roseomonas sp.]|nr:type II toxin-antitoxin system Phd/YefM family antitoxin [Roseomonas sp.]